MELLLRKFFKLVLLTSTLTILVSVMMVELYWIQNRKSVSQVKSTAYKTNMSAVSAVVMSKDASVNPGAKIEETGIGDDARPLLIKKYLTKYNSPLLPYSDLIFKLSQDYGFEYYWILAIGQQESNLCKKIPENSHNCWGYGINSAGTLRFDSYDTALKSYALYLKTQYFDKGYKTPEDIMKKYCPHSNGSWAYGVNQFINEIETGTF